MNLPVKRIGEVAELTMGTSPKGNFYNNERQGLPLLNGPTEFGSHHPNSSVFTTKSVKECLKDDLIFCVRGSTTGRMNWADQVYSLGRGVCAIRASSRMETLFVKYCLDCRLSNLLQLAGGSTFPNLKRDTIKNFEIPWPSNRLRIAEIVSSYDDLIENNRRRMELLEASARHLYEEWFVRLRFPGHEHTKIVDGVPDGWMKLEVSEVFEVNPRTTLAEKREHAWVEMSDLQPNSMVVETCIQREGRSGSKFQNGDTLVARITPCLENGKTAFVDFLEPGEIGRGSTEFIVLRPKLVGPEFVYCFARTYAFREHAIKSMRGASGRQRVQESCLHGFPVLVPPTTLQKVFEEHARVAFRLVRLLQRENERLKSARDLLLPRLMSGEVAV